MPSHFIECCIFTHLQVIKTWALAYEISRHISVWLVWQVFYNNYIVNNIIWSTVWKCIRHTEIWIGLCTYIYIKRVGEGKGEWEWDPYIFERLATQIQLMHDYFKHMQYFDSYSLWLSYLAAGVGVEGFLKLHSSLLSRHWGLSPCLWVDKANI